MQKERKTVKQDKIIIIEPLNKVKDPNPSSRAIDDILSYVL